MVKRVNQETVRIPADYPVPRDILRRHYPNIKDQLCIRGGWGYDQKDAVIIFEHDDEINPDESFDGISLEKVFIHYRLREEAEYAHEAKYVGIHWERTDHRLILGEDGNAYDRETVEVSMFTPEDWDFLKNDWKSHNAYEDNPAGMAEHDKMREERIIRFTEIFWFNVNNIL